MNTPAHSVEMDALRFCCPHCQQRIECEPGHSGTEVQCPACTGSMIVPSAEALAAPAVRPAPVLDIDERRPELRGFSDFYAREIAPSLAMQRHQQKSARRFALGEGVVGTIVTGLVGWFMFRSYGMSMFTAVLTAPLFVVTGLMVWGTLDGSQQAIKRVLLPQVCRFFGFEYCRRVDLDAFQSFKDSGLLPKYHEVSLEDRIHGKPNGVEFDMFECRLDTVSFYESDNSFYGSDNSSRRKSSKQVYHGVLFRFAFPKRFNGRTLVLKDGGLIGNMMKGVNTSGERIKLEDRRFENLFEVWGSDQVEARYLLTPTFMERVVELATGMDSKRIEFSFIDNLLLVSVHVTKNQFEGGGLFTSVVDKRRVEQLVNEICRVFDVVNTLQLTLKTRI